jgi:hypothetical protein
MHVIFVVKVDYISPPANWSGSKYCVCNIYSRGIVVVKASHPFIMLQGTINNKDKLVGSLAFSSHFFNIKTKQIMSEKLLNAQNGIENIMTRINYNALLN